MSRDEPFITKNGEVITDELAERIADEAEAGYELDQITNVRPGPAGRKSLAGGSGKSPAIQLRLAPDVYEQVRAAAADAGETLSEFVRDAIDRHLKRSARTSRR